MREVKIKDFDTISDINKSNIKSIFEQLAEYAWNYHQSDWFVHVIDTAYFRDEADSDSYSYNQYTRRVLRMLTPDQKIDLARRCVNLLTKKWEVSPDILRSIGVTDTPLSKDTVDRVCKMLVKGMWRYDWMSAMLELLDASIYRPKSHVDGQAFFKFINKLIAAGDYSDLQAVIVSAVNSINNNKTVYKDLDADNLVLEV